MPTDWHNHRFASKSFGLDCTALVAYFRVCDMFLINNLDVMKYNQVSTPKAVRQYHYKRVSKEYNWRTRYK
ncbi:hypothetical protein BLOT_002381 [Blomia tropicalis]|nr:hypothetical protein BLOT_002381 [Blomia tropicalis]